MVQQIFVSAPTFVRLVLRRHVRETLEVRGWKVGGKREVEVKGEGEGKKTLEV
jgi:hypothetical protein